jgi:hypothetical protein
MTCKIGIFLLLLFPLLEATSVADQKRAQQAPDGDPVLTNQTPIPVNYQFLATPGSSWQVKAVKLGESIIILPGCMRFSTGSPPVVKYYVVEASHRYSFTAEGHNIVLTYNKEDGPGLLETASTNPACIPTKK